MTACGDLRRLQLAVAAVIAVGYPACAGPRWKQVPHDRRFQHTPPPISHERPEPDGFFSEIWDEALLSTIRPLGEALSPGWYIDAVAGGPEALDVNAFGEVIDSSWFTNRIGRRELTPEEVRIGPNRLSGPAPGPLLVISGKLSGATPGFIVQDLAGVEFVVKLDPPAQPELSSGAEVVATKLLWAAGYNVPENYMARLYFERLRLAPDATTPGKYGVSVPMTEERLAAIVTNANPTPDGSVRAVFSRLIRGRHIGPFSYRGTRSGDPNDRIPHQFRRSLRGLWVFSAWLNDVGVGASNTLDTFVLDPGKRGAGHLEHYLLDFGDALGAAGADAKYVGQGYQHRIDWAEIGKAVFSAGAYYPYWLPAQRSPFRSIGVFEAKVFEPERWAPDVPNPTFEVATIRDTFWAASILARFDRRYVAAAVAAAEYSEQGAAAWVRDVLMERREKLLTHAFARVLPLVDPVIVDDFTVVLTDLAVTTRLREQGLSGYRFAVRWNRSGGPDPDLGEGTSDEPAVNLEPAVSEVRRIHGDAFAADPFITIHWQRTDGGPAMEIHLRVVGERLVPVGIWRAVE